ncbi:24438_t:CDS:2, partial [Gigaspora margarita]
DKSDYLNQLKNELAHSVPIDPSNIVANVKVIGTLNDLITNRDVTMISKLPKSSNLDNQYDFILK